MVAFHNNARATVSPQAESMSTIVWDSELESIAQNWANQCNGTLLLNHNPNRGANYSGGNDVGENIAADTAYITGEVAVNLWDAEKQYYQIIPNLCKGVIYDVFNSTWSACGHYTQLVYAETSRVGCGRVYCSNFEYQYNIVCDYFIAGNVYDFNTGVIDRPYTVSNNPTTGTTGISTSDSGISTSGSGIATSGSGIATSGSGIATSGSFITTTNSSTSLNLVTTGSSGSVTSAPDEINSKNSSFSISSQTTIIGTVIGAFVVLLVILVVVLIIYRKRRGSNYGGNDYSENTATANIPVVPMSTIHNTRMKTAWDPSPNSNFNSPISHSPPLFQLGQNVQAKYSKDGIFYRAQIADIKNNEYLVKYLDYQEKEWLSASQLKL